MHRIIATTLAVLLLGVPAVAGAAADETATDTETVTVADAEATVVDVDVTGDAPDVEMSTTTASDPLTVATQNEALDRPNCLFADEGDARIGFGALNVAGESLSPLVEAGVAEPCEWQRYDAGIASVTFVTSSEGETTLQAIEHAGFIGIGGLLRVTCDATQAGVAHGPTDDMQTVDCEAQLQGTSPASWGNWDGSIMRDDASGFSYASFTTD
jgi:hypothetical protein